MGGLNICIFPCIRKRSLDNALLKDEAKGSGHLSWAQFKHSSRDTIKAISFLAIQFFMIASILSWEKSIHYIDLSVKRSKGGIVEGISKGWH